MMALRAVLADPGGGWDHMGGWGGGWMWLWGLAMMALFVVLIVWLVRTVGTDAKRFDSTEATSTRSARAILAERYARGDLSTEEYREREAELR